MLILATSYDGLYEGIAVWYLFAILIGGIAFAIARRKTKRQPKLSIIVAALAVFFSLPVTWFVLFASFSGGPIGLGWLMLSVLVFISFSALLVVLFYTVWRFKYPLGGT
jgi:hypothetical protein